MLKGGFPRTLLRRHDLDNEGLGQKVAVSGRRTILRRRHDTDGISLLDFTGIGLILVRVQQVDVSSNISVNCLR